MGILRLKFYYLEFLVLKFLTEIKNHQSRGQIMAQITMEFKICWRKNNPEPPFRLLCYFQDFSMEIFFSGFFTYAKFPTPSLWTQDQRYLVFKIP